jgi:tetratricopeptide (TPR) repeat protein
MEGTRIALMQTAAHSVGEMPRVNAFLLWQTGPQLAAEGRLKLLSHIRDQPAQIDREFANIRVSVDWLKKQSEHNTAELLLAYVEILEPYFHLRGRDSELADWCSAGMDACERLKRNPSQVLLILGNAQYSLGQWEQADASWQAAIAASQGNDRVVHAHTTSALGRLQINQGKYKAGLKTLARAEDLLAKINDTQAIIGVRSEIAAYYLNRRELEKALKLYLEIDEFHKKSGAKESSDHITLMLGVIYRQKRVFDKAIAYLSELCRRGEMHNDKSGLATGSHHLAWVYFELRELEQARHLCGKALALYEDLQDPRGLSDGYEQLGGHPDGGGKA